MNLVFDACAVAGGWFSLEPAGGWFDPELAGAGAPVATPILQDLAHTPQFQALVSM